MSESLITRIPEVGDLVVYHSTLGKAFRATITRVFADDSGPTHEQAEAGYVCVVKARACSPCHLSVDVPHDNTDPEFGTPSLTETDECGEILSPELLSTMAGLALPAPLAHRSDALPEPAEKKTRWFRPIPKIRQYCSQGHSAQPEPGHFCYPTKGAP